LPSKFEAYFGTPAPQDVDFSHEWVAFFGLGTRNTRGNSVVWSEVGAEIGSHAQGAKPALVDELYAECADEIIVQDPVENWVNLVIDASNNLMLSYTTTPRECFDG